MKSDFLRRCFLVAAMAVAGFNLAGCGGSLSGTYVDPVGFPVRSVEFKSGGKVYVTMMTGVTVEATYKRDGDKITIENAGGNLVLTIKPDGSLSGGSGLMTSTLKKKP